MRVTLNEQVQKTWQRYNFEYLRYQYNLTPEDLVIDIGAYQGEWSKEIYRRYKCKLILIEPGPWANGFEHGEVINKAAWIHDGTLKFGGAFYYTSAHEDPTHEYECFDINTLLQQHEEIALVKINIEGGEYQLLDHIINADLHKRIRNLQVQFHIVELEPWQAWYSGIEGRLKLSHHCLWRYPFVWENWRRL